MIKNKNPMNIHLNYNLGAYSRIFMGGRESDPSPPEINVGPPRKHFQSYAVYMLKRSNLALKIDQEQFSCKC